MHIASRNCLINQPAFLPGRVVRYLPPRRAFADLQKRASRCAAMPPAQVRTFGDSPADWYKSLPPVTRAHETICVATTLAFALGLVNPYSLMVTWDHLKHFQVSRPPLPPAPPSVLAPTYHERLGLHCQCTAEVACTALRQRVADAKFMASARSQACLVIMRPFLWAQLWRLVTNYFFVGKFSFNFVILMFWMCASPHASLSSHPSQSATAQPVDMLPMPVLQPTVVSLLFLTGLGWRPL